MDLLKGIYAPVLIAIFLCSGSYSSQLYLQPQSLLHGYFTNDQFFITCFTTDENIDQLKWTDFESNVIDATDGRIHVQPADGAQQGLRLVFSSVEKEDAGKYTCSDVQDSITFDLTVSRSISFGDTPHVQHAAEGDDGTIICRAHADANPVVTWYYNKKQIKNNEKYKILENHSLKVFNLNRTDAGKYKCKALLINSLATQMKDMDIDFHVQYSPEIIGDQRIKHYARIGSKVQLPCSIVADPDPMFEWLRNEMMIYNNTNDGYLIYNSNNSSLLEFMFENEDQLGEYICRANNALGEEEVNVELKEGGPPSPPKLSVISEDQGTLKLRVEPMKDAEQDQELKIKGFKIEYKVSDHSWNDAESQEFNIGEPYLLRNMSFNTEYHLRAAAENVAGYGEFSDEISYKTHTPQVASVTSTASGIVASLLVLFTSIAFFRLF